MPRVVLMGSIGRRFTGGLGEFDVDAGTILRLIAELDQRFPGLGGHVDKNMAVAIDGTIHQDAYAAILAADSEVVLIPKIGAG